MVSFADMVYASEPVELPKILISGEKEGVVPQGTGSRTKISPDAYKGRIVSIPEVLSEQGGMHVTRYGGLSDATSISVRGSGAEEVQVLLDGIPLNSAERGMVDLSPLFLDDLEAIEIYRGYSPFSEGFGSSSAVVSFETKKIDRGRHFSASLGYGSFQTVSSHVSYSERKGKWGISLSNALQRTAGDFRFLDDNGTPANDADDSETARQNNQSQRVNPVVKLSYEFDAKTRLETGIILFRTDRGVPGLGSNQSQTANLDQTEWIWSLKFNHRSFESLTYARGLKSQYSDPQGEIGLGGVQDNDDDTTFFGEKITLNSVLGKNHTLSGIASFQTERFRPENFLVIPSGGSASLRHRFDIGCADEIDLFDRRIGLKSSVWLENVLNRIDNDDPSFLTPAVFENQKAHHEVSAQVGVEGRVFSFLNLEGHFSRTLRYPLFGELFGDQGGVVGNQALSPQKSLNYDLGVVLFSERHAKIGPASFSLLYFDRHLDDLIQFEQNAGFARAENIGEARIWGIEAGGSVHFFRHAALSGHYTFQKAIDEARNPGRILPGRPRYEAFGRLEGWNKWGKVFVSANWIDSNFLDPLNTRVILDRMMINSGLSVKPLDWLGLSLEAKNISNDRIVDVVGFPLPGRSFFGRMDLSYAVRKVKNRGSHP